MGRAIRWVFVTLAACVLALVVVGALVKIDTYQTAVIFASGNDKQLRFASARQMGLAQKGGTSKKMTVVVDGVSYQATYAVSAEQAATVTVYDDNIPSLADGTTVRVKGEGESLLQKVVGL